MSKPVWAQKRLLADRLERKAARLREEAVMGRCLQEDSLGWNCTRDAMHKGECRYAEEDLP